MEIRTRDLLAILWRKKVIAFSLLVATFGYGILFFVNGDQPITGDLTGKTIRLRAPDFCALYRTGVMIVSGDRDKLYDFDAQTEYDAKLWPTSGTEGEDKELAYIQHFLSFFMVPYTALPFCALALLPFAHAFLLWYWLNVAMLMAVPLLLQKSCGLTDKVVAVAMVATPMFFPVQVALSQGQLSVLILLLLTLAFRDFSNRQDFRAGCMLAAASFKPQFVLLLMLVIFVMRRWGAILGFWSASLGLFVLSIAVAGWRATLEYPLAMACYARLPNGAGGDNPAFMFNLRGFIYVVLHSIVPASLVAASVVLISASLVIIAVTPFVRTRANLAPMNFSLVIVVTLVVSYHASIHDMALLVLPLVLLCGYMADQKLNNRNILLALMAGALFILPATVPLLFPVVLLVFGIVLFVEIWKTGAESAALTARGSTPKLVMKRSPADVGAGN